MPEIPNEILSVGVGAEVFSNEYEPHSNLNMAAVE